MVGGDFHDFTKIYIYIFLKSHTPGYASVTLIWEPLIKSTFPSWAWLCENMGQLKAGCEEFIM